MAALLQTYEPIDALSPFGFLLQGKNTQVENSLESHWGWLRQNHMMPADGEALLPSWAKAIKIAARPSSRITMTDVVDEKKRRVLCVANGQEMIFAMFDRQHCLQPCESNGEIQIVWMEGSRMGRPSPVQSEIGHPCAEVEKGQPP